MLTVTKPEWLLIIYFLLICYTTAQNENFNLYLTKVKLQLRNKYNSAHQRKIIFYGNARLKNHTNYVHRKHLNCVWQGDLNNPNSLLYNPSLSTSSSTCKFAALDQI